MNILLSSVPLLSLPNSFSPKFLPIQIKVICSISRLTDQLTTMASYFKIGGRKPASGGWRGAWAKGKIKKKKCGA